jgi:hypothetical protein
MACLTAHFSGRLHIFLGSGKRENSTDMAERGWLVAGREHGKADG